MLITQCRVTLALVSLLEALLAVILFSLILYQWSSDSCNRYSVYGTSESTLCEIGKYLYWFVLTCLVILFIMGVTGVIAAIRVQRVFLAMFFFSSLVFVMFLGFTLTLIVAVDVAVNPFVALCVVCLGLSLVPVWASGMILRFKASDDTDEEDHDDETAVGGIGDDEEMRTQARMAARGPSSGQLSDDSFLANPPAPASRRVIDEFYNSNGNDWAVGPTTQAENETTAQSTSDRRDPRQHPPQQNHCSGGGVGVSSSSSASPTTTRPQRSKSLAALRSLEEELMWLSEPPAVLVVSNPQPRGTATAAATTVALSQKNIPPAAGLAFSSSGQKTLSLNHEADELTLMLL